MTGPSEAESSTPPLPGSPPSTPTSTPTTSVPVPLCALPPPRKWWSRSAGAGWPFRESPPRSVTLDWAVEQLGEDEVKAMLGDLAGATLLW